MRAWVGITETLARAVGYATDFYKALQNVPNWFSTRIGGASIWKDIVDATTTPESRKAAEEAHGIISDPQAIALAGGNDKLREAMLNRANILRGMKDATDISTAVLGDKSKPPPSPSVATPRDAFDRAADTVARETARTEADTKAVGLGAQALAEYRAHRRC